MKEGSGDKNGFDLPKQAAVSPSQNMVRSLFCISFLSTHHIYSLSTKLDVMLLFMFQSSFHF
jgi:hypothetical protein